MDYPWEIVLDAVSNVFAERSRMMQALIEMGYDQAFELTPKKSLLGTPDDPFVLVAYVKGPQIARWYVEADVKGFHVRLLGVPEFMAKIDAIKRRD